MKNKLVYIIGAVVIGIASTLAIIFGLVGGNVIDVEKSSVVFESASLTAVYDGQEHTCSDYSIIEGSLKAGHTPKVVVYGSQTEVGSSLNYMSVTIVDANGTDVSDYYEIDIKLGTLTVNKAPLTITSVSKAKPYDGKLLESHEYAISENSKLAPGHRISADFTQSVTYVGTVANTFSVTVFDSQSRDVTANYDITKEFGSLVVTPRSITVKSPSASKIYDGEPLEDTSFETDEDSLVEGDYIIVDNDSSITNVGTIVNDFSVKIVNKDGNDVSFNYIISCQKGTLQVGIRRIAIETGSDTKEYTGTPIKCESYEIVQGEIAPGDVFDIVYTGSRTDVGETPNKVTWTFKDSDGNDITDNYIVDTQFGTIKVIPRDLFVESATKSKVYDGTPLASTDADLTITDGTLCDGHTIYYRAVTTVTDVCENIENKISPLVFDANNTNVTSNYNIIVTTGTFTILKRDITLTSEDKLKVYNGEKIDCGDITAVGDAADGDILTYSLDTEMTEPGSVTNAITYSVTKADGTDNSLNYNFILNEGTLTIAKRALNIKSLSATKTYDGTPLEKQDYELIESTVADGHTLTVTFLNSLTDAGTIDNEFSILVKDADENDVTSNYELIPEYGTLTVEKQTLTITTLSASKTYDGTPLTSEGYTITDGVIADGEELVVSGSYASILDAGEKDNSFSYMIRNIVANSPKTSNYDITEDFGTLTVSPLAITIQLDSASKQYDGTPLRLTSEDYTITEGELISGHTLTFILAESASINEVGTAVNGMKSGSLKILAVSKDVTANYDITVIDGTLEIVERDITVRSKDRTEEYAGHPLTYKEFDITYGSPAPTDYIVATIDGNLDYIGNATNTFARIKIFRRNSSTDGLIKITTGNTITIGDDTFNSLSTISLLGFNQDFDKVYVKATNDGETFVCFMADASLFDTIDGYDPETDEDVTDSYDILINEGQLILVYSKERTGLSTEEEYASEYSVLSIKADKTGPVYLRSFSYTGYDGDGWTKGTEYTELLDGTYSYNYLTSAVIDGNGGITPSSATIKLINSPYVLPYYMAMDGNGVQTSDILYTGSPEGGEYTVNYYSLTYDDISAMSQPLDYTYASEEVDYYAFVSNAGRYLQIPSDTKTFLDEIIAENSLVSVEDIVNYVRNAADYNISYDRALDSEQDKVIAFLRDYKQGICSHFAEACTMMLRAKGIPARYVSGYYAYAKENEWVTITNMKRHAWTEVYVNGIGWVQIDATAGNTVVNETPLTEAEKSATYYVKPVNISYKAADIEDGETYTLYAPTGLEGLEKLEAKGYTYKKVKTVGTLLGFGTDTSAIDSFVLLDPNGNDVTKDFKFTYYGGKMQTYLQDIAVQTEGMVVTYDGTEHSSSSIKINGVAVTSLEQAATLAGLADGHSFEYLNATASRKEVGEADNVASYKIVDEGGNDVTKYYRITGNCGIIKVTPRDITITADSASGTYNKADPVALTCTTYTITGDLASGDIITVTVSGSQLKPGSSPNTIDSVIIKNAGGEDVTSCYNITTVDGTLTVTVAK
ncbi:MAG: hypothetical protein MJ068_00535 [Clostridia bacterium]|nr:hypothetical protein [Clostridia bacterium]